MKAVRKPLKKSILKGIGLFVIMLCVVLVSVQYFFLRNTLYTQYQNRMRNILGYAESVIDADDLAQCIRNNEKSGRYFATQQELNEIKNRTGVHYLYVLIPLNTKPVDNIRNVIAAVSDQEKDDPDAYVELNGLTGNDYTPEAARKYLEAYDRDGITFFENVTEFGDEYTGMLVLRDREGNRVAALCVDFAVDEIRDQVRESLLDILIVVVILGLLFATVFMIWADRHIIKPIHTVEKDVAELARKSHTSRNPDAMVYSAEGIRTGNEVETLARAVEQMSLDMRDYVKNLVDQEKELVRLSSAVNRDALTHVGNRNAYEQYAESLQLKMTEGHLEYGILLADTNGLKKINDEYGHDKGDMYLQKACRVICEVFHHSPVFRIGGDEFAVMLVSEDYINREALVDQMQTIFYKSAAEETTPPWEKVSVTYGLAEYDEMKDRTVRNVYDRAEDGIRGKRDWLAEHGSPGK
ncbi:MAG: diguanylate cyclase [Clostridia bacterium]|nr:diguanylate cyclase [Clostridia bacterium]